MTLFLRELAIAQAEVIFTKKSMEILFMRDS